MDVPSSKKASSTDIATITIVVVVAAMIIVLLALVIWQIAKNNDSDDDSSDDPVTAASKSNSDSKSRYGAKKRMKPHARLHRRGPSTGGVRMGTGAGAPAKRYGVANPRATAHHEPMYDQPAPMPEMQLNSPENMPPVPGSKIGVQTSMFDQGDNHMATATTEFQGSTASAYMDTNYLQDAGMMTPSTATDIKGLQTFMPYMGGGVGSEEKDGPVDPETGLPLFTTGKLVRSQLLGGIGSGSFLRQQQDPLSGYRKNVGRLLCGAQRGRRDIEMRRKQFNAARLEGDGDPVLFNTGEFAYM